MVLRELWQTVALGVDVHIALERNESQGKILEAEFQRLRMCCQVTTIHRAFQIRARERWFAIAFLSIITPVFFGGLSYKY